MTDENLVPDADDGMSRCEVRIGGIISKPRDYSTYYEIAAPESPGRMVRR